MRDCGTDLRRDRVTNCTLDTLQRSHKILSWRVELQTSSMLGWRSSQLSYERNLLRRPSPSSCTNSFTNQSPYSRHPTTPSLSHTSHIAYPQPLLLAVVPTPFFHSSFTRTSSPTTTVTQFRTISISRNDLSIPIATHHIISP